MEHNTEHSRQTKINSRENQEEKLSLNDVPASTFAYDPNLLGISNNSTPIQQKEEDEETLQMKPSEATQNDNNTGLPDHLKSGIEHLSGKSMNDVNVHYNSSKPTQLNAKAYAQGSQIHLGHGQEEHLPHEAWHVAQQKQGRVKASVQMKGFPINDDQSLENEADVMGNKANSLFNDRLPTSSNTNTSPVQRQTNEMPVQRLKWSEVHTGKVKKIKLTDHQIPDGVEDTGEYEDRQVFAGQTSKGRSGFLWHKEATREIQYDIKSMRQYEIIDDSVVFYTAVRASAEDPIGQYGIDPNYGNKEKPDGPTEYNVRGFNYFAKDTKIPNLYGEKFLSPDPFVILEFTLPIGTLIERDPEIPNGLRTQYHIQPGDLQ